ncbi:MAG: sugar ABC transporter ATP-binding protein [Pyrinomonadaceae bacterium]
MSEKSLLRVVKVSKAYDGVQALVDASFTLNAGEVHALVGENGAGKSTLIKIITGAVRPDDGEIYFSGDAVVGNSPALSRSLGIAAIYQQPALFPELTVAENIAIGQERHSAFGIIKWKQRRRAAQELLTRVGARIDPETLVSDLSMPQQQLVEIARALGADARLLIFDEPTASLSEDDTQNLFRVIRELRAGGVGMVYISHRLEELPQIADRVTVLRDGRTIDTREMAGIGSEELIRLMVGRDLSAVFPKRSVPLGETVFELKNFGSRSAGIFGIDLAIRAGEIVGVAGLIGAGRTELAKTIFGLKAPDHGELFLRGETIRIGHPCEAIEYGIAYLPEDRRKHGVVLDFPISSNITLASLKKLSGFAGLNFGFGREREIAADYTRRIGVKTPGIYNAVSTLSGGNQQKVALSRWLMTKPSVLILDEPTQGIDVGAKAEIHELMMEIAANGVAILMISSELPEILGMSDRIAVMSGGTVVKIFDREGATQDKILSVALGHLGEAAAT